MERNKIDALALDVARRRGRLMGQGFPWQRKELALLDRVQQALEDLAYEIQMAEERAEEREEQFRSEASRLTVQIANAREAAGFERNGFDKLGSVHDSLGNIKDLLKALDLIGDGIGGDIGFAVSAVANEAAMTAENAFAEAATMIEMRGKVTP